MIERPSRVAIKVLLFGARFSEPTTSPNHANDDKMYPQSTNRELHVRCTTQGNCKDFEDKSGVQQD